jgi:diguanylate cyclase (GGDEF)-like protein
MPVSILSVTMAALTARRPLVAAADPTRSLRRPLAVAAALVAAVVVLAAGVLLGLGRPAERIAELAVFGLAIVGILVAVRRTIPPVADPRSRVERDPLTGVLDRRAFLAVADGASRDATAGPVAIVVVDVDGLSQVNDSFGLEVGDALLRAVAERLRLSTTTDDVVGRVGGDRLAVLRPRATVGIEAWARSLGPALAAPVILDGDLLRPTCSIGLHVGHPGEDAIGGLLAAADAAVDQARGRGGNRVQHAAPAQDLGTAPSGIRFRPVVELADGAVVGVDAVVPLGRRAVAQACWAFAADDSPGWVSVGLGFRELVDPRLVSWVEGALSTSGLAPERLVVGVSEALVPSPMVRRGLHRIHALGVKIAVDDFGSGHATIAQICDLPLELAKIHRSLSAPAGGGTRREMAVYLAHVEMAMSRGIPVIAAGIELESQRLLAGAIGCTLGQGPLWEADVEQARP